MSLTKTLPAPPTNSDELVQWANDLYEMLQSFYPAVFIDGSNSKTNLPLFKNSNIDNINKNNLKNIPDGCLIYNKDTGNLEYYSNGAWVVLANV